jgi:hypothetical protein
VVVERKAGDSGELKSEMLSRGLTVLGVPRSNDECSGGSWWLVTLQPAWAEGACPAPA